MSVYVCRIKYYTAWEQMVFNSEATWMLLQTIRSERSQWNEYILCDSVYMKHKTDKANPYHSRLGCWWPSGKDPPQHLTQGTSLLSPTLHCFLEVQSPSSLLPHWEQPCLAFWTSLAFPYSYEWNVLHFISFLPEKSICRLLSCWIHESSPQGVDQDKSPGIPLTI